MRSPRGRLTAVAMALALIATVSVVSPAHASSARTRQEPPTTVPAPIATAAVFVGGATPVATAPGQPIALQTAADLVDVVTEPSASLVTAVATFYRLGGVSAWVVPVPSEDAATLSAAVTAAAAEDFAGPAPLLWSVPSMGSLDGQGYQGLAGALGAAAAADTSNGIALLDPPAAVVPATGGDLGPLVGLAGILRQVIAEPEHVVLLSSPLIEDDTGDIVPGSAAVAGEVARVDMEYGIWASPTGPDSLLAGLSPQLVVDNAGQGTLTVAGVDTFRTIPGHGTFLLGDRTLGPPESSSIAEVRTLTYIHQSLELALQAYVFEPNDQSTWQAVTAEAASFLDSLQADGALAGSTPAEAYTIAVGVGSTMTDQDVLDGIMRMNVTVHLADGRQVDFSLNQEMQT